MRARRSRCPVLRKDFTIDRLTVLEAAAHGADAILLIAAILTEREIRDFREAAARYGMAPWWKCTTGANWTSRSPPAATSSASTIATSRTFEVTLETSLRLAEHMPAGAVRVSESGIHDRGGYRAAARGGLPAFLVGEHLMKSGDPAAALRRLVAA